MEEGYLSDCVYSSIYNENRDVIAEVMAAPGVGAHAVPTDGVNGGLLFNMNGNNGEPGVGAQPVNFNNEGGYEGTPPADAEQQQQQQQPAAASTNITEHFKAEEGTRAQEPQQEQGEGEEPTAAASIAIDNSTTPAYGGGQRPPASAATGGASEHGKLTGYIGLPKISKISSRARRNSPGPSRPSSTTTRRPSPRPPRPSRTTTAAASFFCPPSWPPTRPRRALLPPGTRRTATPSAAPAARAPSGGPPSAPPPCGRLGSANANQSRSMKAGCRRRRRPSAASARGPTKRAGPPSPWQRPKTKGLPRSACKCCQTSKSKPHCDLKKTQFRRCSE